MPFLNHLELIPLLPALGAALMFFFGRGMEKRVVSTICVGVIVLAFICGVGAVWEYNHAYSNGQPFEKNIYTWLGTATGHLPYTGFGGRPVAFNAQVGFLLDPLNCIW